MSSEYQELLEKLLNSDTTDVIPQSRAEYIMLTAINSLDIDTLPEPGSRMEAYLMALITKLSEGGSASSSGGSLIVTYNPDDPTKATHSASEIYEAFQSGKTVQFYNDGTSFRLIISSPYDATFAVSAVLDSESNAVVLVTIDINDSSEITIIGPAFVPAISTTAEVGQTLVVKSVNRNGQPTEWEAVGMEGVPTVTTANNGQFLRVVNGAWSAATVPSAEEASF